VIWKSKDHRAKAIKWMACLPQSVWFALLEDHGSPVWEIDYQDREFFREVQLLRSGRDGPTRTAIVHYLANMLRDPTLLVNCVEVKNGSAEDQAIRDRQAQAA